MSKKSREKKLAHLKEQRECLYGLYELTGGFENKPIGSPEYKNAKSIMDKIIEFEDCIIHLERAKEKRKRVHHEKPSVPDKPSYLRVGTVAHKRKRKKELKEEICKDPILGILKFGYHSKYVNDIAEEEYQRELRKLNRE